LFAELVGGFNLPNPDLSGPKGRNFTTKFFPRGKLGAKLDGGFNLLNPDLSGPKGRNFIMKFFPRGKLFAELVGGSWKLLEIKTPTYPDESGITTSPKGGTLS
jgi:hypothetical protein